MDRTRERILKLAEAKIFDSFSTFGAEGVAALAAATPTKTGASAASWSYEVINEGGIHGIRWLNTNMAGPTGTPVVILLQYGHGTGTGGYVVGRDFINPVIVPLFERIKDEVRKAVSSV